MISVGGSQQILHIIISLFFKQNNSYDSFFKVCSIFIISPLVIGLDIKIIIMKLTYLLFHNEPSSISAFLSLFHPYL